MITHDCICIKKQSTLFLSKCFYNVCFTFDYCKVVVGLCTWAEVGALGINVLKLRVPGRGKSIREKAKVLGWGTGCI